MRIKLLWKTFLANWQTISGLFLFGFMTVHFFGVSLINIGEKALNWYTAHLDKSNWIIVVAVLMVLVVALLHMLNGFKIMWPYIKSPSKVHAYVLGMGYFDSFLWFAHFVSGAIVATGLTAHILIACLLGLHTITTVAIIREQFQSQSYWLAMGVFLMALVVHMMIGMHSVIIKYDFLPKYRKWIFLALAIGGFMLVTLGLNNLFLLR